MRYRQSMREILAGIRGEDISKNLTEAKVTKEEDETEEHSMFIKQCEFIKYAAEEMIEWLQAGADLPEWFESKLAAAHSSIRELHSYMEGDKRDGDGENDMPESVKESLEEKFGPLAQKFQKAKPGTEITQGDITINRGKPGGVHSISKGGKTIGDFSLDSDFPLWVVNINGHRGQVVVDDIDDIVDWVKKNVKEDLSIVEGKSSTGYELYHKDFSTAMQHAYDFAKKKFGITVDPKEIDDKVATGPRKPSKGKTNTYRLKGDKGAIHVQVYGMDNGKYELNMYKEEVELGEAFAVNIKKGGKVPVGQWTFIYKTEKPPKYIENSIKGYDKDAKVVTKGDEVHVTATAGAHNSLIDSMRRLRVNGSVSEAVELGEAKTLTLTGKDRKKYDVEVVPNKNSIEFKVTDVIQKSFKTMSLGQMSKMFEASDIGRASKLAVMRGQRNHAAAKEIEAYASKSGGIDKKDFQTAAALLKRGVYDDLSKHVKGMDTDPRDKVIELIKKSYPEMAALIIRKAGLREEVEINEVLKVSDGLGAWITDFQKSDAPQFSGKSKEERQKMAIAAFVDAGGKLEQKEELEEKVNKDDVTKLLVKYGNNPKEVERMVSKEFDRAVKTYPQATAKKIAEIIRVLAEEGDLDKACWKGYKAVGMKDKDGKKVPNCVPESVNEEGPEKTDMQKGQDDKKKTRIAQLQLQIAKATETLNKLKSQGE